MEAPANAETLSGVCTPRALTPEERLTIVRQGILLIEESYVHLTMKRELHGVDPVGSMQLLLRSLEQNPGRFDDSEFHRQLINILTRVRDRHLAYLLPGCLDGYYALLPFTVREIREKGRRLYVVDEVTGDTGDPEFRDGVEITLWNGVNIRQAVLNNGELESGTTADARRAMGVDSLTSRAIVRDGLPEDAPIVVGYRDGAGSPRELEVTWNVGKEAAPVPFAESDIDTKLDGRQQARRSVSLRVRAREGGKTFSDYSPIPTPLDDVFEARKYGSNESAFGYIGIRRFKRKKNHTDDAFVKEFVRLLGEMPRARLVLDIRDNPGGNIAAAERMLQTLTDSEIEPATFQFRNTKRNLALCKAAPASEKLEPWIDAIEKGLAAGKPYSTSFPKTTRLECNEIGRKYPGRSVLITNARSYSAADFFAAGFQDHGIGRLLGVHPRTGGGGANVWMYTEKFNKFLPETYPPLAAGISFAVAVRRSRRVGLNEGRLLEEAGVEADVTRELTRKDVLGDDIDIITAAASMID